MTAQKAIEIIDDEFIEKAWYSIPRWGIVPKSIFEQCAYQMWAIKEIKDTIRLYSDKNPVDVVEIFMRQMDSYSCVDKKGSYIFSIAKDVAEHALDILIRYSREEQKWII